MLLPQNWDVTMLALAQSGALICGFLTLLALSPLAKPTWPATRDMFSLALATGMMVACVWPLRNMAPGVTTLLAQALTGGLAYCVVLLALNVGGLRNHIANMRDEWFRSKL